MRTLPPLILSPLSSCPLSALSSPQMGSFDILIFSLGLLVVLILVLLIVLILVLLIVLILVLLIVLISLLLIVLMVLLSTSRFRTLCTTASTSLSHW